MFNSGSSTAAAFRSFGAVGRACISALLTGAIFFLIVLSFRFGIDRGDDTKVTERGIGQFVSSVCAIYSMQKYGTGRYVCAQPATLHMQAVGLSYVPETLRQIGMTLSQWRQNTTFLDRRLRLIFAEPAKANATEVDSIGWGFDAGYMDFVNLSFSVFGYKVESLYWCFFAILIGSTALFCFQFRDNHFALFVLLALQYAIYKFITHDIYAWQLGGANSPRLLSVLALPPLLHLLFLMTYRVHVRVSTVILVIVQAAVVFLAGDGRALAYWTAIALGIYAAFFVALGLWRHWARFDQLMKRCWPVGVFFAVLAVGFVLTARAADPRIGPTGGMRSHTFWEPLYYDLQYHPQWNAKYGAQHDYQTGDSTTLVAVNSYRERHHLLDNLADYRNGDKGQGLTLQAYEKYTRAAFLEFVRNDPWFFVQVKYYNAVVVLVQLNAVLVQLCHVVTARFLLLAAGLAAILAWRFRRRPDEFSALTWSTAAIAAFIPLAAGPIWATVPNTDLMGDMAIVTIFSVLSVGLWVLIALFLLTADNLVLLTGHLRGTPRQQPGPADTVKP